MFPPCVIGYGLLMFYIQILDQVMGAYGYSIEHMLMVDIIPDAAVRKAMNEINAGSDLVQLPCCLLHPDVISFLNFQH